MNSKKVYLIRHGQTDFNLKGIVQGSGVDTDLNSTGWKQATDFFNHYNHIHFDKVYTSTLKRSRQSVQSFLDAGIAYEALSGLNEICWGKQEGRPITIEEDAYYHNMIHQWQMGNTGLRIDGGESPEEVVIRMQPAMDYIMNQDQEETILICMHGRAIRILLCHLLNYPLRSMDMFAHQNLCLYQLAFTGTMFHIEKYNDISHLPVN